MQNTLENTGEDKLRLKIQGLLGKEITHFFLKGKGDCNNAYYIETREGGKYIVKEVRTDTEGGVQNNNSVTEGNLIKQLSTLGLSIHLPQVVFTSENPQMFGYEYIEGSMLREVWHSLLEKERIDICRTLGRFHAEIGKKLTKERAQKIGIIINEYTDIHPENVCDCRSTLASPDVPEEYKQLLNEARNVFDGAMDKLVFQFLHKQNGGRLAAPGLCSNFPERFLSFLAPRDRL